MALLVYLARSTRGRSRDHLIGLLWSEKDDAKARHSLNEALRVIRRVAGEALTTDGDMVRLDPAAVNLCWGEDSRAGGEFMEGFLLPDAPAFEDWLERERGRVRSDAVERLLAEAEELIDGGDPGGGRKVAQRILEIEPLHEPAVRALMRGHALSGARALALQAYDRLHSALAAEFGVEPDPATKDLALRIGKERIVRGAPAAERGSAEAVPLVGRGRSCLAACLSTWEATCAGRPSLVILRGDPGTGKTRIGDEFAARARLEGAVVAQVRALPRDTAARIWSALLRGGLLVPELGGAAPQVLAGFAAYDPDIATRFPAARGVEPGDLPESPIAQGVFAIAESRPVLLVIDDAGAADAEVIETVGAVVQRAGDARVCAVLAASSGRGAASLDALAERVGRDIEGRIVRTGVLESGDVAELVAWAFPAYDADAADRLSRRVMADTGGIPFLAVEFVRAVQVGLSMRDEGDQRVWPAEHRTLDQTIPGDLPETVAAALRTRFRALTLDAQNLLRAVAVVGGGEPTSLLAQAVDVPLERAERALDELEWERWLAGDARGYGFVTRLAEAVVLSEMVTAGARRRMLERAGRR